MTNKARSWKKSSAWKWIALGAALLGLSAAVRALPIDQWLRAFNEWVGGLGAWGIFSLTERPGRLGVIGAGPIGCEMAQAFARFGSEVVLVASEHGILPREDSDASKIVREALERDGVALRGHGRELTVSRADGAKIRLRG